MTSNAIGLSSELYSMLERKVSRSKSQSIRYTFAGDTFQTRIVRREGELIGYDPSHPEGRPIIDYDKLAAEASSPAESGTFKGWMMCELMRRGLTMDIALQQIYTHLPPMVLGLPSPTPGTAQAAAATEFVNAMLAGVGGGAATTPSG